MLGSLVVTAIKKKKNLSLSLPCRAVVKASAVLAGPRGQQLLCTNELAN